IWPLEIDLASLDPQTSTREEISGMLSDDILSAYEARAEEFGPELTGWLERQVLLQIIDNRWREHLYEMDYLREGIHLRGFAQIDPLVAYKNEGFIMFEELMASIWQEFARVMFHVEVNVEERREELEARAKAPTEVNYSGGTEEGQPSALRDAAAQAPAAAGAATTTAPAARRQQGNGGGENPATVVKTENEKLGRNDPCWCGSGKKFKNCHGG
ncbi:MAG TPA: SEC-C metal-binding domain-containing protein, partial [Solirubrobacterales bacterium]|nr:SEC-C metal-binding domain-containing protein [Solirubrobacterales bacterium]